MKISKFKQEFTNALKEHNNDRKSRFSKVYEYNQPKYCIYGYSMVNSMYDIVGKIHGRGIYHGFEYYFIETLKSNDKYNFIGKKKAVYKSWVKFECKTKEELMIELL